MIAGESGDRVIAIVSVFCSWQNSSIRIKSAFGMTPLESHVIRVYFSKEGLGTFQRDKKEGRPNALKEDVDNRNPGKIDKREREQPRYRVANISGFMSRRRFVHSTSSVAYLWDLFFG